MNLFAPKEASGCARPARPPTRPRSGRGADAFPRAALFFFWLLLSSATAQTAPEKPQPNARFGNWLYRAPDPSVWQRSETKDVLVFSVPRPPSDFCTLTLFATAPAELDFAAQFNRAIDVDQKAKGTVKIEADSGVTPSKAPEGYDVLTRSLRSETSGARSLHMYVAGRSGDRFNLAAFQTTSEASWNEHGLAASHFIQSLKLANALSPAQVKALVGETPAAVAPPPTLPGFGPAPAPVAAKAPTPVTPPRPQPKVPDRPLSASSIVVNHAVIQKNGQPVDGIKLSQHDLEIASPAIAVAGNGSIHVAFIENHKTTYAPAIYHRASSDGGKSWSEAKNLSEDMPGIKVGRCHILVDGSQRIYAIWRAGLGPNFGASPEPGGASQSNLMYRVLENGRWSKIIPAHPPGSPQAQNDGSLSYFATVDPAGRVQVLWNARPDKWHPELTVLSGTYRQSLPGVGNGLVFQATLDGTTPTTPREVFLTPVSGQGEQGGYGTRCDGLDSINGYIAADGTPHFVAAIKRSYDSSLQGKSRYVVIDHTTMGPALDLPDLSYHAWRSVPTLLVDAAGRQHVLLLYPAGENPSIRDYLIGSDEEPVIIRKAASGKGTVDGFQAYQGPGGRMVAIMQMNDSGEKAGGDTFVSISSGKGWSTPVNVTNNGGRKSFASRQTSRASNIAIAKSYYPGPAAAAFDRDGNLLLLMINNEYGLFGSSAFGVLMAGGSSSTPALQFLRF